MIILPGFLSVQSYYSLSKTEAESEAWEFARQSGIDLVTVCPSLVWGPLLQSTTNSSSLSLINIMKGNRYIDMKSIDNENAEWRSFHLTSQKV